jgi:hypothetical protein
MNDANERRMQDAWTMDPVKATKAAQLLPTTHFLSMSMCLPMGQNISLATGMS